MHKKDIRTIVLVVDDSPDTLGMLTEAIEDAEGIGGIVDDQDDRPYVLLMHGCV